MYQDVMRNSRLSPEAKAVYAYLSSIAGCGETCYPSVETIQKDMAMSKNRLSKYMNELIASGVVEKTREKNGNLYGRNVYKITHEAEIAEDMKRIILAVENRAVGVKEVEAGDLTNDTTNNNNTNNNSITNNNNSNTVCSEPEKPAPNPSGILLPLNDKTVYDVPLDKIAVWKDAYPAVNVEQELKRMAAWLDSNPTRRKTRRGITKFINTWLSREQDEGGRFKGSRQQGQELTPQDYELPEEYREMYKKHLGKKPPSPDDPFQ